VPGPANPQSWNRYTYGYNNPVKYSDPTGHYVVDSGVGGAYTCSDQLSCETIAKDPRLATIGDGTCGEDCTITIGSNGMAQANTPTGFLEPFATYVYEPKPEFPISPPWTQEAGNTFSYWTDVIGTGISGGKTLLSAGGVLGYVLGPEWALADLFGDESEDFYDWVSLGLDLTGEIATGDTRLDLEQGILVLGSESTRSVVFLVADRMIPGSGFDLATNLYDTGYGVLKLNGLTSNDDWELQISTSGVDLVIYVPSGTN